MSALRGATAVTARRSAAIIAATLPAPGRVVAEQELGLRWLHGRKEMGAQVRVSAGRASVGVRGSLHGFIHHLLDTLFTYLTPFFLD